MKPSITDKTRLGRKRILGLNSNVFSLGIVSLLTDVSSEMIFTLVPLFLLNVLMAPFTAIGLVGGLSESVDAIFRICSGWLSDRLGRRKPLAILGYGLSSIAKPFMYIAATWGIAFGVRFADRVGKGIRTAPRDALVADSLMPEQMGKGFGLHRAMDTFGAVAGIISAIVVVHLCQGNNWALTQGTYQQLVLIGVIPAVLALFVFFFVKEPEKKTSGQITYRARPGGLLSGFDKRFKLFLGIMFLFTLGNSSDAFLVLRAQNLGNPVLHILLMLLLFNISASPWLRHKLVGNYGCCSPSMGFTMDWPRAQPALSWLTWCRWRKGERPMAFSTVW